MQLPDFTDSYILRKWIERVLTYTGLLGAFSLLALGDVFEADLYDPMKLIASPIVWGMLWLSLMLVRVVILIVNGHWPSSPTARFYCSAATLTFVWLPLLMCFWVSAFRYAVDIPAGALLPGAYGFLLPVFGELVCMTSMQQWINAERVAITASKERPEVANGC